MLSAGIMAKPWDQWTRLSPQLKKLLLISQTSKQRKAIPPDWFDFYFGEPVVCMLPRFTSNQLAPLLVFGIAFVVAGLRQTILLHERSRPASWHGLNISPKSILRGNHDFSKGAFKWSLKESRAHCA